MTCCRQAQPCQVIRASFVRRCMIRAVLLFLSPFLQCFNEHGKIPNSPGTLIWYLTAYYFLAQVRFTSSASF
ncbi:hypothetical protein OIU76_015352 [Salix suchowensis]|nr:hypothetical protein OIU76_015352 [Salix suchowensis]